MKIPRSGPVWFLIVGIPLIGLSISALVAALLHLPRLEKFLRNWFEEIMGAYR